MEGQAADPMIEACLSCSTIINYFEDMPLHQLRKTMLGESMLSDAMCPTILSNSCDKCERSIALVDKPSYTDL